MMKLMMAFMPSCRELSETLTGEGLAALPWYRRLMARMHLSRCDLCARFARQIDRISEALKESWSVSRGGDIEMFKRRVIDVLSSHP